MSCTFEQNYGQTELTAGRPMCASLAPGALVQPGVYEFGLVSILDEELGNSILSSWQWLFFDAIGVAATWQGNVFFWSPKRSACFYLDAESGKSIQVAETVEALVNDVLPSENAKANLLRFDGFQEVYDRMGELQYGRCYYPRPLPMLGGSGNLDTYGEGDMEVYLAIVAQTFKHILDNR